MTACVVSSSIWKKKLMALSAIVWTGFVAGHMAGNLLILVKADWYNLYGHKIVSNPWLLYGTEAVLVAAILMHVFLGLKLTLENKNAREGGYAVAPSAAKAATFASRTMAQTGSIILVFIITHLITFKYGAHYETTVDGVQMRDLHRLIVEVFHNPIYVTWYVVALVLLGFHLSHGVSSIFQSLGLNHPTYRPWFKRAAYAYAIVVTAGFLSQPLYVYFLHKG